MKRTLFAALAACLSLTAMAQLNIQMHYDLGAATNPDTEHGRALYTSTLEFFHPDKLGSTFLFVDMDYRASNNEKGMMSAYWEVSREFAFMRWNKRRCNFSAHAEYNGGLGQAGPFQQVLLLGPAWNWHSRDMQRTFSAQLLYRQTLPTAELRAVSGLQATVVWGLTFADGWCTFSGYADYWHGYVANRVAKRGMIFMAEPQLWANVLCKADTQQKLAIGTEWEVSNNFVWRTAGKRSFFFNPTVALKWTF